MRVLNRKFDAFVSWCAVVLYADLIYAFSSMERLPLGFEAKFHTDKLVHGVEYAILGWLLARSLRVSFRFRTWSRIVWMAVLLGTLYALLDEYHQSFIPHRESSLSDVLADAVGLFCGAQIWVTRLARSKKKVYDNA